MLNLLDTLFCKNKETEIGQKITTNLEGKCKDKKNNNDELHFFKTRYTRMT